MPQHRILFALDRSPLVPLCEEAFQRKNLPSTAPWQPPRVQPLLLLLLLLLLLWPFAFCCCCCCCCCGRLLFGCPLLVWCATYLGRGWVLVVERGRKRFKIAWLKDLNSESHHQNKLKQTRQRFEQARFFPRQTNNNNTAKPPALVDTTSPAKQLTITTFRK
jgi:hypothetical protein